MGEKLNGELFQVESLIKKGQLNAAKEKLIDLIGQYPKDAKLHYQCGSVHDRLGFEREAIPFYEKALKLGIAGIAREETFVQLGSSYRAIGQYEKAKQVLEQGLNEFPNNHALLVFLAMTNYNIGANKEAVEMCIKVIVETSNDEWIGKYRRAIDFYQQYIDEQW